MRSAVLLIILLTIASHFAIAQDGKPAPTPDPGKIAALKEQNVKAVKLNGIITEFNTAASSKNWQSAADAALRLIAIDPRWDFYAGLGDADMNLAKYDDAVAAYETAVTKAGTLESLKSADARTKTALSHALVNQGNAYLKLKKNEDAFRSYERSAELAADRGVAYFNICAVTYNLGEMTAAAVACDKSIAVDPKRAEAYFIKGSALYGNGTLDAKGNYIVPPGTVDALKKYLELAPNGAHSADVKAMIDALGK